MSLPENKLKNILEAAMMAVAKPMSIEQLMKLFSDEERPSVSKVKDALNHLQQDCEGRGIELKDVASGYRYQARQDYAEWISRLWEEKPAKYSRAYLETLALIAYRQPVTRGEIEDVRGVGVSSSIIKTMLEREWIRVVGHRDVPGRPSLYATTKQFLDYFDMKSLDELPSLAEIKDLDELNPELGLNEPGQLDESEEIDHKKENSESEAPNDPATMIENESAAELENEVVDESGDDDSENDDMNHRDINTDAEDLINSELTDAEPTNSDLTQTENEQSYATDGKVDEFLSDLIENDQTTS